MQALHYHNNKRAIAQIEAGRYGNVLLMKDMLGVMQNLHQELLLMRENMYQAMRNQLAWEEINQKILDATNIYVFLGYMLRLYKV